MSLDLKPGVLEQYVADMRLARQARNSCVHCYVRGPGESYCSRHQLLCAHCGTSEVAHREAYVFADGVPEWLCNLCVAADERRNPVAERIDEIARELGRCPAEVRELRHDDALSIRQARRAS